MRSIGGWFHDTVQNNSISSLTASGAVPRGESSSPATTPLPSGVSIFASRLADTGPGCLGSGDHLMAAKPWVLLACCSDGARPCLSLNSVAGRYFGPMFVLPNLEHANKTNPATMTDAAMLWYPPSVVQRCAKSPRNWNQS